jgi:uncharacterized protein YaaQ
MKLMVVIIQDKDSDGVVEALVEQGLSVTRMSSTGGFLRKGNVTLLIGIEPDRVEAINDQLKRRCTSAEPNLHAATVFVLEMPEYLKV